MHIVRGRVVLMLLINVTRKKEETTGQKYNAAFATQGGH